MRATCAGLATGALIATHSSAQSASVTVTHNDADGILLPGEIVRVQFAVSWSPSPAWMLASLRGDAVTSPNGGELINRGSDFQSGQLVNLGSVSGASVIGFEAWHQPPGWVPSITPPFVTTPALAAWFDWRAPTNTGTYQFKWNPHAQQQSILLWYRFGTQITPTAASTTYFGASIIVVPTPPSGGLILVFAAWFAPVRRRHSTK